MNPEEQIKINIVKGDLSFVDYITDFQMKMAKETQNKQPNQELVKQTIQKIIKQSFGVYLISLRGNTPIGCLLLSFDTDKSCWMNSVFIQKIQRGKKIFKLLFQEACKVVKDKSYSSLKLSAFKDNQSAIKMYQKLGMIPTGQFYYTYDFLYGKTKLQNFLDRSDGYEIKSECTQNQFKQVQNFRDLLKKNRQTSNKKLWIYHLGKLIGTIQYFIEYSEWRYGINYFIQSFLVSNDLNQQQIHKIHCSLCSYFNSQQVIGCIRYIYTQKSERIFQIVKGGQIQPQVVMEINI